MQNTRNDLGHYINLKASDFYVTSKSKLYSEITWASAPAVFGACHLKILALASLLSTPGSDLIMSQGKY